MNRDEVAKLVADAKSGSQKAFTKLYNTYYSTIYLSIYKNVKNKEVAEDLSSETFAKAFKKIVQFEQNISFEMWLKTIATNSTIDFLRKQSKKSDLEYIEDDKFENLIYTDNSNPEKSYIKNEIRLIVEKNINALSEKTKRILLLRYKDGLSYQEIADKVGLNIGTIKSYISKATAKIKPKN